MVVHSPFRTAGLQAVINIKKGSWIDISIFKKEIFFHIVEWGLIVPSVPFQQ